VTAGSSGAVGRFASFDGREIAYLDTGPADAPLALLLHGFASEHRETWLDRGVVGALVDAGRRVVAWDARGHGQSDRPHAPEAYADNAMVRDAGALLDHLGVTAPRSIDVVGYSMGSVVSSRWVPDEPRVRSLVLGGVGEHIADGSRDAIRGKMAKYLAVDDPATIRNQWLRDLRTQFEAKGNDCKALAALDAAGQDDPTPDQLAGMGVPVLVLTGADDTLVGSPDGLAARIPGAVARVIPGDHPGATADPAFAAAVVEFLASVDGVDPRAARPRPIDKGDPSPTDPSEVPAP
jgi:pimeloyl-ACP methyl ester carboxylesterase